MKAFLHQYKVNLCIEGHADISGSDAINQPLSEARAESAKMVLIEDYGFPGAQFSTADMAVSSLPPIIPVSRVAALTVG